MRVVLPKPPEGVVVVPYGGGVNTIAELLLMEENGIVPTAIVMADPGHEKRATIRYRDDVMRPWLAKVGFPDITVVSRKTLLVGRKGAKNVETLGELCERTSSLPSIAYGWKKCSFNYKQAPQWWWTEEQAWAQAEWAAGRKLVKAIGYDAGETKRVKRDFNDDDENSKYVPYYPLYDAGVDRDGCVEVIAERGFPAVVKSSCTFCPNMELDEWVELAREEPEAFAYAVEMSRRSTATVEQPEVVGLLRRQRVGRRQLHVWVDNGYPDMPFDPSAPSAGSDSAEMPCECSL